MSAVAQVKDGQIVESASQSSLNKEKTKNSTGMDKDAFLQLLVAQMKYQDPLEPTSNTEYVSQYAQFSQVEQMQNMAGTMTLQRASGLVGQDVIIETTNSAGKTTTVQGRVDYITYENNKAYLSVNGALYSMDDLKNVVDQKYLEAYDKGVAYVGKVNKLPGLDNISADDEEKITALMEEYDAMSDYEKTFIANDVLATLKAYSEKVRELNASETASDAEETEENEAAGTTEEA